MTGLLTTLSSAAMAGVLGLSIAVPVSAAAYDPASVYVEQFNGLGMHKNMTGMTVEESDPARDYIESFGWTKMTVAPHGNSSGIEDDRTEADIESLR